MRHHIIFGSDGELLVFYLNWDAWAKDDSEQPPLSGSACVWMIPGTEG